MSEYTNRFYIIVPTYIDYQIIFVPVTRLGVYTL